MPRRFVLLLLTALTALTVWLARDYGASYDEPGLYRYAREARLAYAQAAQGIFDFNYTDPIQKHYGPFFLIAASLFSEALTPFGWGEPDRWHLFYGLFFLVSAAGLYRLARRWFSGWSAFGLTALFITQPVLWGHAWMNPKDPPFLGFLIWTALLGLNLADRAAAREKIFPPAENPWREWNSLPASARAADRRIARLAVQTALGLWALFFSLRWLAEKLLQNPAAPLSQLIFRLTAFTPILPPENYLKKLALWGVWLCAALTFSLALALLTFFLRRLPLTRARWLRPAREFLFWLSRPQVILTSAALGVTLSLRLTAGLLALTLALIFVWRLRSRALPLLLAFGLWSAAALYLSWPFLWLRPLKNLLKSLAVMTEFAQPGPWYAYPRLLLWQWTEPALALMILGSCLFLNNLVRRRASGEISFLLVGLSLTPIAALMVSANTLYDNFRQVLFIWLGFFLLTGFAFEWFFGWLKAWPVRLTLILLAMSASGLAIFQLHPYEYLYYNSLAGGLNSAASRGLPTDYWGLSLREAARFLNKTAPAQASILTCGPVDSLKADLRPGLSAIYGCDESAGGFDYALVHFPANAPRPFDNLPAAWSVQRQGVTLLRIVRLHP